MAISLTHNFVSTVPDDADTSIVRPQNWNDEHVLRTGGLSVIGKSDAGNGDATELAPTLSGQVLRLSSDGLTLGFGAVDLASSNAVTGVLGVSKGGTGTSSALTEGAVVVAGAAGSFTGNVAALYWQSAERVLNIGVPGGVYDNVNSDTALLLYGADSSRNAQLVVSDVDYNHFLSITSGHFADNFTRITWRQTDSLSFGTVLSPSLSSYNELMTIDSSGNVSVDGALTLGTPLTDGNISSAGSWNTAYSHSQLTSGNPHNVTKSDVGLSVVENTALSTWAGSTNITTLGTVSTGTWSGTAIGVTKGGTGTTTQFTAGSIVFAGASGVYSQNNSNLYWDNTNYRLGIGRSSPTFQLDIKASTSTSATDIVSLKNTDGYGIYGQTRNITNRGNTLELRAYDYNAASPVTREIMTFRPEGNAGLGITTPASQLHVYENTSSVGTACGLTIQNAGAGDAVTQYVVNATRWASGIDNSDSDTYKIASSADLSSGDANLIINSSGCVTLPFQPCFNAYNTSIASNVTGDGTIATVPFATIVLDANVDYNNSTYIFTAPVTGKYLLIANVQMLQMTGTYVNLLMNTSNRTYYMADFGTGAADTGSNLLVNGSVIADMDAGDTAKVQLQVNGGSKVTDIYSSTYTYFHGCLLA